MSSVGDLATLKREGLGETPNGLACHTRLCGLKHNSCMGCVRNHHRENAKCVFPDMGVLF